MVLIVGESTAWPIIMGDMAVIMYRDIEEVREYGDRTRPA